MNKIEQAKRESVTSYYYADVNLYDVPTFEEEQELFKRIRNGDIEARNEIIERNLRFVVNIARQFIKANETLPFPDLIQDGNLGLTQKETSLQSRRYILIINIHNRGINTTQFYISSIDNPWKPPFPK